MTTSAIAATGLGAVERPPRRTSLLGVATALLATGAANAGVTAAKKQGKKCRKKEKTRCSKDAAACKTSLAATCQQLGPELCAALMGCCDQCSAAGFLTCVDALQQM
jgi:hypothetical protein